MRVIQSNVVQLEPDLRVVCQPIVECGLRLKVKRRLELFEREPTSVGLHVVLKSGACDRCPLISEIVRADTQPIVDLPSAFAPVPVFIRVVAVRQSYARVFIVGVKEIVLNEN